MRINYPTRESNLKKSLIAEKHLHRIKQREANRSKRSTKPLIPILKSARIRIKVLEHHQVNEITPR